MNDLKTLLGWETTGDSAENPGRSQDDENVRLRALVGAGSSDPAPGSDAAETASPSAQVPGGRAHDLQLSDLVGEGPPEVRSTLSSGLAALVGERGSVEGGSGVRPSAAVARADLIALAGEGTGDPAGSSPRASDADTRAELAALTGTADPDAREEPASASADLTALVGAQGKSATEGWLAPELAQAGDRPLFGGRRRVGAVNYLSIVAAIIAVVALVGTASFAVVQRATANPADDAMVGLREREAELANDTGVLRTAADLYEASVAEARTLAETSAPVLAGLQGRLSAAPLAAAEGSRAALLQTAEAAVPVTVPEYQRLAIDEQSLADVARAIDAVRVARESLPVLVAGARDSRSQVTAAISAFRAELSALGGALQADAQTLLEENDAAGSSFGIAVTDAAARVVSAQQAGGDGLAEMSAFAAAVDALRAENDRVLAFEDEVPRTSPTRPSTQSPGSGGSNSVGGYTPGSTPSQTPTPTESSSPAPSTDPSVPPTGEETGEPSLPPVDVEVPGTDS